MVISDMAKKNNVHENVNLVVLLQASLSQKHMCPWPPDSFIHTWFTMNKSIWMLEVQVLRMNILSWKRRIKDSMSGVVVITEWTFITFISCGQYLYTSTMALFQKWHLSWICCFVERVEASYIGVRIAFVAPSRLAWKTIFEH